MIIKLQLEIYVDIISLTKYIESNALYDYYTSVDKGCKWNVLSELVQEFSKFLILASFKWF